MLDEILYSTEMVIDSIINISVNVWTTNIENKFLKIKNYKFKFWEDKLLDLKSNLILFNNNFSLFLIISKQQKIVF